MGTSATPNGAPQSMTVDQILANPDAARGLEFVHHTEQGAGGTTGTTSQPTAEGVIHNSDPSAGVVGADQGASSQAGGTDQNAAGASTGGTSTGGTTQQAGGAGAGGATTNAAGSSGAQAAGGGQGASSQPTAATGAQGGQQAGGAGGASSGAQMQAQAVTVTFADGTTQTLRPPQSFT